MKLKVSKGNHGLGLIFLAALALGFIPSQTATAEHNIQGEHQAGVLSTIIITDSGWTTQTGTSGWGDDTWQLMLTQLRNVTISVDDCCCPGDYYEVRVDGNLIGTTPNLAPPWGCDYYGGPLSSGSFTIPLCPGTHIITVRDAGFDGHSLEEIEAQNMCPAGFTVSGTLSEPGSPGNPGTTKLGSTQQPIDPRAAELQQQSDAIAPYVVTDAKGMQKLLIDDAKAAGVSDDALELGNKLVGLNNKIVTAAATDEPPTFGATEFDFIQPLFLHWAQEGTPCGDIFHPSPCPPRVESGEFFSTEAEVRDHLISLGYHRTANYAGGGSGRDFTKVVEHPCGFGPFRSRAVIHELHGCWTYNTQQPEPNPEFRSYQWPYHSWVAYVAWWHFVYC